MLKLPKWLCISFWLVASSIAYGKDVACDGKFPNFITDVCWSCAFPIKLFGSVDLSGTAGKKQEDTNSTSTKICNCGPKVGVVLSFWEPGRMVDMTRAPYCLVNMGGIQAKAPINENKFGGPAPMGAVIQPDGTPIPTPADSFWHAHWYINPLLGLLDLVTASSCLENQQFDLAYLSELDPTWDDPDLLFLKTPDAALFANPLAGLACTADCVAATSGWPLSEMFWCAGCNGPVYPMLGQIRPHINNIQATSLALHRLTASMHRSGSQLAASGEDALCTPQPQYIMDKQGYKYTILNPVPQTEKKNGRCCQPMGRTTVDISGKGREMARKSNYGFLLYRKRDCCQDVLRP